MYRSSRHFSTCYCSEVSCSVVRPRDIQRAGGPVRPSALCSKLVGDAHGDFSLGCRSSAPMPATRQPGQGPDRHGYRRRLLSIIPHSIQRLRCIRRLAVDLKFALQSERWKNRSLLNDFLTIIRWLSRCAISACADIPTPSGRSEIDVTSNRDSAAVGRKAYGYECAKASNCIHGIGRCQRHLVAGSRG